MRFVKESMIRASPERVFAFHEQPEVLELLIPPWENARVIEPALISHVGSRATMETKVFGPIAVRWIAEHTVYEPPHLFEDVQVKGPFRSWRHSHVVERTNAGALLRDEIEYELPFGFLGRVLAKALIEKRLHRLFDYRHEVTKRWCE
jgi:ligand-binding SRPBCC domain-containing protein